MAFLYDFRSYARNFRSWQLYAIMNYQQCCFVLKANSGESMLNRRYRNQNLAIKRPVILTLTIWKHRFNMLEPLCLASILNNNFGQKWWIHKWGEGIWRARSSCLQNLNEIRTIQSSTFCGKFYGRDSASGSLIRIQFTLLKIMAFRRSYAPVKPFCRWIYVNRLKKLNKFVGEL